MDDARLAAGDVPVVPAYRKVSEGVLPLVSWTVTRTLTMLDAQGGARRFEFERPVVESVFAGVNGTSWHETVVVTVQTPELL